uniref:Protein arginine N-methyltransferase n=1 Tax=Eutreptiella gymnastica TaxID=73025 RepID=A0A7S1HZV3_9EUGL
MPAPPTCGPMRPLAIASHEAYYGGWDAGVPIRQAKHRGPWTTLAGLATAALCLVLLLCVRAGASTTTSLAGLVPFTSTVASQPMVTSANQASQPMSRVLRRRDALFLAPTATAAAFSLFRPKPVLAAPPPELQYSLSWITENVQSTDFDLENYGSMRDDEDRTGKFYKAIERRMKGKEGKLVVLDVGTGPFALLAIAAARAGAKKVYAIEATPEIAVQARKAIDEAGFSKVIEVLVGYSTEITLPEKVDLLVGEIIGSVASEESVYGTIRDAQARFMKEPSNPKSYIPQRVQTLVAPVSWPFHYMVAAEGREAAGLASGEGPIRLNCREETVALMADAQTLEDFAYSDPNLPQGHWEAPPLSFQVSGKRISENTRRYIDVLFGAGASVNEKDVASSVATGFSGMAMWPKLILDEEDADLVVDARGPGGAPQKSHWQTVLALMPDKPLPLRPGATIEVRGSADFGAPLEPVGYSVATTVIPR